MPEATTIYDRDWNELYKIYSEKRTYVSYENINKNMINAIVAWEDKRFWTHPWYDWIGIVRAFFKWIFNWMNFSWTSWINQQLAKVTYLSDERTIERKVKELYLSIELDSIFDKKDILELYLNKIFFWWNSYWIEQASQTYFWTWASNLWVLESSILASLPKAPTGLSPYQHKDILLGYPSIIDMNGMAEDIKILSNIDLEINKKEIDLLINFINNLSWKRWSSHMQICWIDETDMKINWVEVNENWCSFIRYNNLLSFLNSIYVSHDNLYIKYKTWRKDYVLWRMLEDWYITFDQYILEIISSFWFDSLKQIPYTNK